LRRRVVDEKTSSFQKVVKGSQVLHPIWMTLLNYRSSHEYREILRILQKSTTQAENILWQSQHLGKNVINLHHFEIDFVSREVVVSYDAGRFKIDQELPLYVKLDYRSSVFKVSQYRIRPNTIHFSFPVEVKTQELRLKPRHLFVPSVEKYVGLRPSMPSSLTRDTGAVLNVRVLDISEFGLGLLISENNRSFVKNNRILWITSLQGETLPYPVLAEVMYINTEVDPKYQVRKQKDLKVGLKLSGIIPDGTYHKFIH
jgi:hypothetical protein